MSRRADQELEIQVGTEIELEHTKSRARARQIALDHLAEDPHYYAHLAECGMLHNQSADQATEAVLVESLPDPPRPGIYVARSNTAAYALLSAMVTAEDAEFLGERREVDGERYIAVSVGGHRRNRSGAMGTLIQIVPPGELRRNAERLRMEIGPQWYSSAFKTYRAWREAWWREAIQNSVDAGATRIDCEVKEIDDQKVLVTVADNGSGMDRDTFVHRFMATGGTTKTTQSGTAGGFGKAKELLTVPWMAWEMRTQDLVARGQNIDYDLDRVPEFLKGTRLTVTMPSDQATDLSTAMAFVAKCYLPHVRFTFNGEAPKTKPDLAPEAPLKSFAQGVEIAIAKGHAKKQRFEQSMLVRAQMPGGRGSLFMWSMYCPSEIKGQLLVEITRPTIELLNDNRQGFRDDSLELSIERFRSELAQDTKSALRKKDELDRVKYEGSGKFKVEVERAEKRLAAAIEESVPKTRAGSPLDKAALSSVLELLGDVLGGVSGEDTSGAPEFWALPKAAEAMLEHVTIRGPTHVESLAKQLAWKPDFYLYSEIKGYKIPKRFRPEGMSQPMKKLARLWAELCRMVLMQLNSSSEYGVGFLFDDGSSSYDGSSTRAMYLQDGSENWLLLNPFKAGTMEEVLSVASKDDLQWLLAAAIHECTHLADGVHRHEESFAAAFTENVGRCAHLIEALPAIKRVVYAELRGEKSGRAQAKPAEAPKVAGPRMLESVYDLAPLQDKEKGGWSVLGRYRGPGDEVVAFQGPGGELWFEIYGSNGMLVRFEEKSLAGIPRLHGTDLGPIPVMVDGTAEWIDAWLRAGGDVYRIPGVTIVSPARWVHVRERWSDAYFSYEIPVEEP